MTALLKALLLAVAPALLEELYRVAKLWLYGAKNGTQPKPPDQPGTTPR